MRGHPVFEAVTEEMARRERHAVTFGAKAALEVPKGEQAVAELAVRFEVDPMAVHRWKEAPHGGAPVVFERGGTPKAPEMDTETMRDRHAGIGELAVTGDPPQGSGDLIGAAVPASMSRELEFTSVRRPAARPGGDDRSATCPADWRSTGQVRSGAPTSRPSGCGGLSPPPGDRGLARPPGVDLTVADTLEAEFRADALDEAVARSGRSETMNAEPTDRGIPFMARAWIDPPRGAGIRISMDGKDRFLTTSSSGGSGASWNANASTFVLVRPDRRRARASGQGSRPATITARTPPSTARRPTWSTRTARRSCDPVRAPGA